MSRINTNVSSLISQRVLGQQNKSMSTSLERLSTGLRINRGADDPAGLIASENLRAEKSSISAAISNAERADQIMNVAEGGLQEVSSLLQELNGLVGQSANEAGLSSEEKEANQLQVDSILQTIDRIANSTSFQGMKLLNGTFDYTTSNINQAQLDDVKVNAARIPTSNGSFVGVTVDVVTSATVADVQMDITANGLNSGSLTIEVAGNKGTQQFTFACGTTNAQIASAINTFTDVTGVKASAAGTTVDFLSSEFGSDEFVSVSKIAGKAAYDTYIGGSTNAKDSGSDAVVRINGTQATTDGLKARVSSASLDVEISLDKAFNVAGNSSTFQVTGGGATFSLSPKVELAGKASMGIQSVTTGNLGSDINGLLSDLKSGGAANVLNGDVDKAQRIVADSIKEISGMRGRLGAFQKNTVNATIRSLGVALENTSAAESQIRDTDFASQTAEMTRSQIMQQAATNVLSMANSQPQSVLSLLR